MRSLTPAEASSADGGAEARPDPVGDSCQGGYTKLRSPADIHPFGWRILSEGTDRGHHATVPDILRADTSGGVECH